MKYYVILQECIDSFFGPSLYENIVYKNKEDAEKRLEEIDSCLEVWIEEMDVK